MTTNAIAYQNYVENRRHNLETEAIQKTSNIIGQQQATAALRNAETNASNAVSNRMQAESSQTQAAASWKQAQTAASYNTGWLAETNRHNVAVEENEALKTSMKVITDTFGVMSQVAGWFGLS